MTRSDRGWYDDAAGPVVRPYAMTRGRTRGAGGPDRLDLIALVVAVELPADDADDIADDPSYAPEHADILGTARLGPTSLADLAGELDLPVGVVRVLVGDLLDAGLVRVRPPVPPAELPDESILRDVMERLRAL